MNSKAGILFVSLLLLPFFAAGCDSREEPKQAVLILLDAARSDRFSSYGYERMTTPHMDGLAERGLLCKNHYTQGTNTYTGLPTLLYSRYYALPLFPHSSEVPLVDPDHLFRRTDDECISLPRALSKAGLKTAAVSAHLWLGEGTRFAGEFDELHDLTIHLDPGRAFTFAEDVMDFTIQWIEEHREKDYFLYVHLMDTHFPHYFNDEAREFLGTSRGPLEGFDAYGRPKDKDRTLTEEERAYLDALYDGSLKYADRHIGRLIRSLEGMGRLDDTLIVVTADHGEHLLEQPNRWEHSGPWYEAVGRIPLIVHYPRKLEPGRIEALTESTDVFPTMLDLLDCALPAGKKTEGQTLVPGETDAGVEGKFAFMKQGLRGKRYKLISTQLNSVLLGDRRMESENPEGMLFDLDSDPAEIHDLWSERPDIVRMLLAVFRERMKVSYHRYIGAVSHEQPDSFIAVSTRYLQSNREVSVAGSRSPQPYIRDETWIGQWIVSRHFTDHWLLGREDAPPLYIKFPIPDGEYRLTVSMAGSGSFQLRADEAPREIRGPPVVPGKTLTWQDVPLGRIRVQGRMFHALLTPKTGEDAFIIQHIGFQPKGVRSGDRGPDEDQLERLRALGYGK